MSVKFEFGEKSLSYVETRSASISSDLLLASHFLHCQNIAADGGRSDLVLSELKPVGGFSGDGGFPL